MNREQILALAKAESAKVVDYDLLGNPITDADVLLMNAYGPLVIRIANAAIQQYKDSLLKDVGEPVRYAFRRKGLDDFCTCDKERFDEINSKPHLFETAEFYTESQLLAAVAKKDEEIEHVRGELKLARQCAEFCFQQAKDCGLDAAVQNAAVHELGQQLIAAQEEIERWKNGGYTNLWKQRTEDRDETIERQRLTLLELRDQLAKAEQRVAEACANYVNRFINGDGILNEVWISDIESALRNGQWRKFLKEGV